MAGLLAASLVSAAARADEAAGASAGTGPLAPVERAFDRAELGAFVWNTSPVALGKGVVLGGGLGGHRSVAGGFLVGARLAFGATSEATRQWNVTHYHGLAAALVGYQGRLGAGRISAQLGLGGLALRQVAKRQQLQRLEAAGVGELTRDGWSVGPWVSTELGLSVAFREPWLVQLRFGPGFTSQRVDGARRNSWLATGELGVGRAF